MKKIITVGLVMMSACHVTYAADDKSVTTRAGKLAITGELNEMKLLFNGKKILDGGGLSLSLQKKYSVGDSDVVLAMDNSGGTACPVQYFFITVTGKANTAQLSPEFGTCSDLAKPSQKATKIMVMMPNMTGKGTSKYVYENGVVTENGKVVK